MYKITVSKKGYVQAVYFNANAAIGEWIARITHGNRCSYTIECA